MRLESLEDPVRKLFPGTPGLTTFSACSRGQPASPLRSRRDCLECQEAADQSRDQHGASVPGPLRADRSGPYRRDVRRRSSQVRRGSLREARTRRFPPTIIAAVDALSAWGLNERAAALFATGWRTSSARTGRLTTTAPRSANMVSCCTRLVCWNSERAPAAGGRTASGRWTGSPKCCSPCADAGPDGLIAGVPEADTRKQVSKYFHNNGWVAKGLRSWSPFAAPRRQRDHEARSRRRDRQGGGGRHTRARSGPPGRRSPTIAVSPRVEPTERPPRATGTRRFLYELPLLARTAFERRSARRAGRSRCQFAAHLRRAVLRDDAIRGAP